MASRIAYTVRGTVQGVNYRYYTAKEAQKLGVTGFVQNDDSGTVSGEAQGSDDQLKSFVKVLNQGPPLAKVTGVDQSTIDTKQSESKFEQYR